MRIELKTITLGGRHEGDDPTVTICRGHVDVETFKKAFIAEGWSDGAGITKDDIRYEYWIEYKNRWAESEEGIKKAEPVTVMDW